MLNFSFVASFHSLALPVPRIAAVLIGCGELMFELFQHTQSLTLAIIILVNSIHERNMIKGAITATKGHFRNRPVVFREYMSLGTLVLRSGASE
jgi:hypothetical protein